MGGDWGNYHKVAEDSDDFVGVERARRQAATPLRWGMGPQSVPSGSYRGTHVSRPVGTRNPLVPSG